MNTQIKVRGKLRNDLWDKVATQVPEQVCSRTQSKVWDKIVNQVEDQATDQVRNLVWDKVCDNEYPN